MISLTDSVVGANAGRSRGHNRQVVLGRIRYATRIGRAEIARASGLSTQAVSNIIADLMDDGLITEQGRRAHKRGLPAVQYSLNPGGGLAIGIEIRPDAVFGAVLNLCGERVAHHRQQMVTKSRDDVARAVRAMEASLLGKPGIDKTRLLGLGVVMPGPFGNTGISDGASELAIRDETPPDVWLSDLLGTPVLVENDANAAAIAERVSGVAQGLDTYAYLYFGRGLGLGVVCKGRLMAGAFGNAGEIGKLYFPAAGTMTALEDAVSRLSAQQALRNSGIKAANVDDLARLYDDGDKTILSWLNKAIEPLSGAISVVENLLDPQTVVLGGAMPDNILDHLVANIHLSGHTVSNRSPREHPRLQRGVSGRMTATLGAAALVVNHAFTPKISPQPQEL